MQISDHAKLVQTLERFQAEYNSSSSKPLGLVFFQDAVDHIASIARVLRQPRGNALLVGVSGSGKQSLTRFAAALAGCACVQLELTKAYSLTDFREDLKVLPALFLHQTAVILPWGNCFAMCCMWGVLNVCINARCGMLGCVCNNRAELDRVLMLTLLHKHSSSAHK